MLKVNPCIRQSILDILLTLWSVCVCMCVCREGVRLKTHRQNMVVSRLRWPSGKGCAYVILVGQIIRSRNWAESWEVSFIGDCFYIRSAYDLSGIYSPLFLKPRPWIPFSSKASWQPSEEWQSSFWPVSGECTATMMELNLSNSQKNVCYIFQLFVKHAP